MIYHTWVICSLLTCDVAAPGGEVVVVDGGGGSLGDGADCCLWWWTADVLHFAVVDLGLDLSRYLTSITFLFSWGLQMVILGEGMEQDMVTSSS